MSSELITEAAEALVAALQTVDGVRSYTDLGAVVDPPATILGPPALSWQGIGSTPAEARFLVIVAEQADDRAMPRLWDLVPRVAEALEDVQDAVVISATPGSWTTGGTELPCYEITVEISL